MAVRIRKNGTIICAAVTEPEPGDTYLSDPVCERLCNCLPNSLHVLVAYGVDENGADLWRFQAPRTEAHEIDFSAEQGETGKTQFPQTSQEVE